MDKAPRSRGNTCDYCNTDKFGLGGFNNRVNIFCGVWCQAWYIHCVYTPPEQYELPLHKPPEPTAANR